MRLTNRLEQLCRDGKGPSLRTFTRVIEIANLTAAFRRLYGPLTMRVERFFNWQIAAIGLACLAIAYGLCRIIIRFPS